MRTSLGLFGFLQLILFVAASSKITAINETDVLLSRTLSAIHSALQFFERNHQSVNLDSIIGTRIVEGQFKILLEKIAQSPEKWSANAEQIQQIRVLKNLAGKVSNDAIPYIAALTPKYFQKIGLMLQKGFWEIDYSSRDFDQSVIIWPFKAGEALHEDDSDNCIAEFFGRGKRTSEPCVITDRCWQMLTAPLYNGYSLSHEIFYLEIGQQFGCSRQMELMRRLHRQKPVDSLSMDFCANMFNEAALIAEENFPESRQDLFMEQAVLCGMLGYRQFFSSDWLKKILSWQNKQLGCYKGTPVRETEVEYRSYAGTSKIRRKREERPLEHGCLCHRTTVAIGALGQYVRFMMEYEAFTENSNVK